MRLTPQELKKHNAKVLKIAELRCANAAIPGFAVSFPDFLKSGIDHVQLALPCGVIRNQKRKINAMQIKTGAFTTSLAKEKTKYDDQLGDEYVDDTDYLPFDHSLMDGLGTIVKDADIVIPSSDKPHVPNKVVVDGLPFQRSKGILDL